MQDVGSDGLLPEKFRDIRSALGCEFGYEHFSQTSFDCRWFVTSQIEKLVYKSSVVGIGRCDQFSALFMTAGVLATVALLLACIPSNQIPMPSMKNPKSAMEYFILYRVKLSAI